MADNTLRLPLLFSIKYETELANYLGCTKDYVSQLLNGNFDHKMSKIVELALALGKAPKLEFEDLNQYIKDDRSYESCLT